MARKNLKKIDVGRAFAQARGLVRGDAWENPLTGLGTSGNSTSGFSGRDKVYAGQFFDPGFIGWPELTALYHNNALAAKIVEFKPKEMFRKGYCLQVPDLTPGGESDNQLAEDLEEYGKRIQMNQQFLEGWIWGRLFGGNLLIIGADDGLDPSLPLNENGIRTIRFLNNVDKRFVYAHTYYADPLMPNFGKPATYMVTNTMDGPVGKTFGQNATMIIHETRCIRFDGSPVDIIKRRQLAGWSLSILQRVYDILRAYDSSYQAAANLMTDAAQGVYKMKGVFDMIASGNVNDLQTRMATVDMQRSSGRSLVLDLEEDFERKTTPMTGVPDILDRFMLQVAMAAEIPVNILFGRVSQGMGATGDSDFRAFYDTVMSEQQTFLKPLLLRLYTLICKAKDSPTGGNVPDKLDIDFASLWEMTAAEKADIELKYAQKDALYVANGVLLPEQVALSRYRKGEFDPDTEIDVATLEASLDAEHDFKLQTSEAKAEAGPMVAGEDPDGQSENKALPQPGPQAGKPGETS